MVSTAQQIINHVVVGALAMLLLGGTIALLLVGRPVPEFLVGFDGVIVTAAFANGAFFVQARASLPVANALAQSMAQHHELAIAGIPNVKTSASGMTEVTSGTGS